MTCAGCELRPLATDSSGGEAPLLAAPQGYVCHRTRGPVQIDGKLNDASWQGIPWTADFVDIEGHRKPRPRFRTRAKMLWDDENFYIAAELEEQHVWATLTKHDSVIFHDNDFEVFIDPNGDNHEYYEFEINALNTGWDLLLTRPYKDGGKAVNSWEIPGLKTAVDVQGTLNDPRDIDAGWTLELAFPWKVLAELAYQPAPPREGDQWRVNFSRVEWQHAIVNGKYQKVKNTKEDNWVWSPQGVINMHRPESWGYVQFTKEAIGAVAFRPDPSLPARQALHDIYYAQQAYRAKKSRWATSLAELGYTPQENSSFEAAPTLNVIGDQFLASVFLRLPQGKSQRWNIRHDARIWYSAR